MSNTSGASNTAGGCLALQNNLTGNDNVGIGDSAMISNQTGSMNAALGVGALGGDVDGSNNTGVGFNTLSNNADGSNNIAIGSSAGASLTSGDKNIYVGNKGKSTESNTIRVGQAQTRTFIAGVSGTPVSGSTVLVNSKGQLGILASSARYKRDVQAMGERSDGLLDLRPVTFRYKSDSSDELQYGLVAEEVARVYPELVVRTESGAVQSVKYEELIPMLLNQIQRQQKQLDAQAARLARLEEAASAGGRTLASR